METPRSGLGRVIVSVSRLGLPVAIAVAGVVLLIVGHGTTPAAGAGVGLLIVGLIVWMVNWMFRMSVESNHDREREEMAREYFDRHGHWPDERPRTTSGGGG